MIKIREVGKDEKNVIKNVVNIHLSTFTGFFLTFMGKGFLNQMYTCYCAHTGSGLFVAENETGEVMGFLGFSTNMSGLYKFMIKKRIIPFAWYSLGAFLRKPKVFMRLVRAFLKPGESERNEEYVELSSIGVNPKLKSNGIGSLLVCELKKRTDFEKYEYINLETDALDNDAANRFYLKNGFTLVRTYDTREGRRMNEYRYSRSEN